MAPQYGRPEVRDQQQDFLIERTRIALWVLFGGTLVPPQPSSETRAKLAALAAGAPRP